MVKQLVPWQISRIQVHRNPKARRTPLDVPFMHRASNLLANSGNLVFEVEPLSAISFPRTKFKEAVRVDIFVHGTAKELHPAASAAEPAVESPEDVDDQRYRVPIVPKNPQHSEELWFEAVSDQQCPRPVRSATARMHINLANLTWAELVKWLVMWGAKSAALASANALRVYP